jgi:CHASE2 domain-containing sensor protein
MNAEKTRVPGWFWLVALIALIWNLLGVSAYLVQAFGGQEMLDALPKAEREIIEYRPPWATGAFAVAVWGGLLGSIMLLLRKTLAIMLFALSLIGLALQMSYNLFIAETSVDMEPGAVFMTLTIPLFSLFLIYIARKAKKRGWLR